MQFQLFMVSGTGDGIEALNQFLRNHRIVSIEKRFVERETPHWYFCVEYLDKQPKAQEKRPKVDYREVFGEEDFAVYAKLRDLRKKVAENEGVPVYAVFTNEQLAQMVQNRVADKTGLAAISGVGASKMEKYAKDFLDCLKESWKTS